MARRVCALFCWAFGVWMLLTWTLTVQQLASGAGIAAVVAVALAPLGDVAGPWQLRSPRRLAATAALLLLAARRIVIANLRLLTHEPGLSGHRDRRDSDRHTADGPARRFPTGSWR